MRNGFGILSETYSYLTFADASAPRGAMSKRSSPTHTPTPRASSTRPRRRGNGRWSATGFVNYLGHYYNSQNAPPNVNNQCLAANGTVGGSIRNTNIQQRSGLEFSQFGRNPNDFVNADGRLNGDVGWQYKLQAVV